MKRGKAKLSSEKLERRILLSATWTGTAGDDVWTGGPAPTADEAHGGDGNDTLDGDKADDHLFGEAGNDTLLGGQGADILDGGTGDDIMDGGVGNDTLISGGGNDVMDGGIGNDTFQFTGAQDGDTITAVGDLGGQDTIDLSGYTNDVITDDGSTLTVDMGSGQSFTVNYTNIDKIRTADGEYAPGNIPVPNTAPTADDLSLDIDEDAAASAVTLGGSDPDAGDAVESYRIDTLPTDGTLSLNGTAVNAGDSISQADIDAGHLTFTPDGDYNGSTSFTYSAYDGDDYSAAPATMTINVAAVNDGPTAEAGADEAVNAGDLVTLNASSSSDLDGDALTYSWSQTGGPAVTLSDSSAAVPTFASPGVSAPTDLTFEVEVSDGTATHTDTVTITVNPVAPAPAPPPAPAPAAPSIPASPPPAPTGSGAGGEDSVVETEETPVAEVEAGLDEEVELGATDAGDLSAETSADAATESTVEVEPEVVVEVVPEGASDLDGVPEADAGSAAEADGDDAADVPPTPVGEAPASDVGSSDPDGDASAAGDSGWDGTEDMGVLDPMGDLGDAVEFAAGDDADSVSFGHDPSVEAADAAYDFVDDDILVAAEAGQGPVSDSAASFVPPTGMSAEDVFVEVEAGFNPGESAGLDAEGHAAAELAPGGRDSRDEPGAPDRDMPTAEAADLSEGAAAGADASGFGAVASAGFFAKLFAAVRGLGGARKESGNDDDGGERSRS